MIVWLHKSLLDSAHLHILLILFILDVRINADTHAQLRAVGPIAHIHIPAAAVAFFELLYENKTHLSIHIHFEAESL